MAKIKKTDVSVKDVFSDVRNSAKKTISVLNEVSKILVKNLELQKKSLAGLKSTRVNDLNKLSAANQKVGRTLSQLSAVEKQLIVEHKNLAKANSVKQAQLQQIKLLTAEQIKNVKAEQKAILVKNGVIKDEVAERKKLAAAKKQQIADSKKEQIEAKKLAKDLEIQSNAFKRLTLKTNKAQAEFQRLAAEFGVNSKQAKKALRSFNILDKSLDKINKRSKSGHRRVGVYAEAFGKLGGFLKRGLGLIGIASAIGLVTRAFSGAIKTIVGFQKANSELKAILNASKSEMNDLSLQAKQLGESTKFTAIEVVKLQTNFARLGFKTTAIKQMTASTLDAAAALGSELGEQATLTGATLNSFNLKAFDTARVNDVLAKAAANSALDFSKLSTALPIVGATAKTAGVSLERTTALLGTLTDRGIDASSSATALRNIFLELSKKGLTWNEAMKKIQNSTDKNKTALELFGKRGATVGVILAQTGKDVDNLTRKLNNSTGAAKEMADVMLDNLAGDITKSKSAWSGFILALEDGQGVLANVTRSIIQNFTKLLTKLSRLARSYTQNLRNDIENSNKEITNNVLKTAKDNIKIQADKNALELQELKNQLDAKLISEKEYNSKSKKIKEDFAKFQKEANKKAAKEELDKIKQQAKLLGVSLNTSKEFIIQESANLNKIISSATPSKFTQKSLSILTKGASDVVGAIAADSNVKIKNAKKGLALNEKQLLLLDKKKKLEQFLKDLDTEANIKKLGEIDLTVKSTKATKNKIKVLDELITKTRALTKSEVDAANKEEKRREKSKKKQQNDFLKRNGIHPTQITDMDASEKRREKKLKEREKRRQQIRKDSLAIISEIEKRYFDRQQKQEDLKIEKAQKREQRLQDLADKGIQDAKDSLAKNQKDQAEAEKRKEDLIQKEKQFQLALSLFKAFNSELDANPKGGSGQALTKALLSTSLITAMAAALPKFIEGTDEVSSTYGKPQLNGQDGHIIRVDGKEQIWSEKDRTEVGFRNRENIKGIVKDFDNGLLTYALNSKNTGIAYVSKTDTGIEKLLTSNSKIVEAIENKEVDKGWRIDELKKLVYHSVATKNREETTVFKL